GDTAKKTTGVRRMKARINPRHHVSAKEDGFDDHHIEGVSAGDIRIVEEKLVTIEETRTLRIPLDELLDRVGSGGGKSQVTGTSEDHRAFCGIERCHAFAALRYDGRGGDPLDGAPSFLTDRPAAMKERFIFNRIEIELPGPWHDLFSFSLIRSGRACARLSQETKIDDITDRDFRRDQGA